MYYFIVHNNHLEKYNNLKTKNSYFHGLNLHSPDFILLPLRCIVVAVQYVICECILSIELIINRCIK